MSSSNISWFHCGRCGSLFLSPAGESADRFCTSCGCNPSLGVEPPDPSPAEPAASQSTDIGASGKTGTRKKNQAKKTKRSFFMLKLAAGWLLVLGAIVYGANRMWKDKSENRPAVKSTAPAKEVVSAEDINFLNEASPPCSQTLSGFLAAGTPEERNQFVSSPITTAARMARFYEMNPMGGIDPKTITLDNSTIIRLPGGNGVEIQMSSAEGRLLDAAFVRENDEWRLDWDHFSRYSDQPWALFLAGSGEAEAEFRLLARERLAEERKDADTLSIVLYAPRFGYAKDTGFQSPEFLVRRDTPDGRLLEAAFKLEQSGKRVFSPSQPGIDPEGLIRIRVKIRRFEQDLERRFEIVRVIACHWYSVDDPGVVVENPPVEK